MIEVIHEPMNEVFDKFHLKQLPFDAVLHHFRSTVPENAHDHPFSFTTHILKGGYKERIYHIHEDGTWSEEIVERLPGSVHRVEADNIHEIIEFLEGECWTIILPEPKQKEACFYQFREDGVYARVWNEDEFRKIVTKRQNNLAVK